MSDLPPMSDAILDDEAVAALFRDVREVAELDEIIIKAGPGYVDDQQGVTLDQAHALLNDKAVTGVQLRYRHGGSQWWDTLLPMADGVRLVRVKHDFT